MSDDGLRAALVAIKAKLQERSDEGEAHLFLNIPYWELEELLAEYPAESPHLTDDGAAAPPADKGAANAPAAESATPTAAPSSPHLDAKRRLAADVLHDGRHFCHFSIRPNCYIWRECNEEAAALVSAGLFSEGATPAIDRDAAIDGIVDNYGQGERTRAERIVDSVLSLAIGRAS